MQDNRPFVSVIVPVYNGEKYISQTIESLIKQPCKDLEIIIINDGSTDKSESICKEFQAKDSRIQYYSQKNSGVSVARNAGIEKSKGKYIAFLDADDVWCKDFYDDNLVERILSDKCDIISFGLIFADERVTFGSLSPFRGKDNEIEISNKLEYSWNSFSAYFYKKNIIDDHNIFFAKKRKYQEDCEFRFKCFCASKTVKCINKYIFVYRNNMLSATHHIKHIDEFLQTVYVWKDALEWLREKPSYYSIKAEETCKVMMINNICEYIRLAAEFGESSDNIKDILIKNTLMNELKNENNYYMNEITSQTQKLFLADADGYFKTLRKRSFIRRCINKMGINKSLWLRRLQQKLRYKTDIKEYIY